MSKEEFDAGRRIAYFGSMFGAGADAPAVRVIRWCKTGVRVRFADGHQETVHADYLHAKRG